jgi:hypothetical protein
VRERDECEERKERSERVLQVFLFWVLWNKWSLYLRPSGQKIHEKMLTISSNKGNAN